MRTSVIPSTVLWAAILSLAAPAFLSPAPSRSLPSSASPDFPTADSCRGVHMGSNGGFVCGLTLLSSPTATPEGFRTPLPAPSPTPSLSAVVFSTYLGGEGGEWSGGITVSASGEAFVAGETTSTDFPTSAPYQASIASFGGYGDAFVTRLQASGTDLLFSTYLGGSHNDSGEAVALLASGDIVVAGTTYSSDFPTLDPYQAARPGGRDVLVTRFISSGSALLFSTYLGGGGSDSAEALALSSAGEVLVAGDTFSADFPTLNPYQRTKGGVYFSDAFAARLSSSGSALVFSTYLGGEDVEYGYAIALLPSGETVIAGETASANFPTLHPYQASHGGGTDAFLSRLGSSGSALAFSTYLGGGLDDSAYDAALSSAGEVTIAGATSSSDFPTCDPFQSANSGSGDAFASRFASAGSVLLYSTYLGGNQDDYADGVASGISGDLYLAGATSSANFPTFIPTQAGYAGSTDGFVSRLGPGGSSLIFSTYLGGSGNDWVCAMALASAREVFVTGETDSLGFPTSNAYQAGLRGGYDAFVTKLVLAVSPTPSPTPDGYKTPTPAPTSVPSAAPTAALPSPSPSVAVPTPTPSSYVPSPTPSPTASPTPSVRPTASPTPSPVPTPGRLVIDADDYDGDGASDLGLWRATDGSWRIRNVTLAYYGLAGDIPAAGDFDADGTADIALFRPASGQWYIRNPAGGTLAKVYYGLNGDTPVPADYDGDFRTDTAVWRPSAGHWYIKGQTHFGYGLRGDVPIPGDYDGDGQADPAVFRPSAVGAMWYVRGITARSWGLAGDSMAPGDYNGDGTTEFSLFRRGAGAWYILGSPPVAFGQVGDIPVVIDFEGDGTQDRGLYRPSEGCWYIYGVTMISYGTDNDQPAVGRTY